MLIRSEAETDANAIRAVNLAAFGAPAEANLVEAIRQIVHPFISYVADDAGSIVGHIMYSPVTLPGFDQLNIMGLAPMAVLPERQRQGIGSELVRAGFQACEQFGFGAVVVLGHPEYYPRLGFVPASSFDINCHYDVPDEAFLAIELQPGYLADAAGKVEYHAVFNSL